MDFLPKMSLSISIFSKNDLIDIDIFKNVLIDIDIDISMNVFIDIDIDIDIFKSDLIDIDIDIDIDISMNVFIDNDIDIDIFNSDLINNDIDIFKTCRYIDNRYGSSIYRTPLLSRHSLHNLCQSYQTIPSQLKSTKINKTSDF